MIGVEQNRPDNCFTACLASILELSIEEVPNFVDDKDRWFQNLLDWLKGFGLSAMYFFHDPGARVPMGFSILSVQSVRSKDWDHCVVALDGTIVWDPSPHRADGIGAPKYWTVITVLDPAKVMTKTKCLG